MRTVFADTSYWIATAHATDELHGLASAFDLKDTILVTSQEVLTELLSHLSKSGPIFRLAGVNMARAAMDDPAIEISWSSHERFLLSLALYEARQDKGYSLVDCSSMLIMREYGMTEVLTGDRHFEQEGFVALLRDAAPR